MNKLAQIVDNVIEIDEINKELSLFAIERIRRKRLLLYLSSLFEPIEKTGRKVVELKVSADVFGVMRKTLNADDMIMETSAEKLKKGIMGVIWGTTICVPPGPSSGICEAIGESNDSN